MDKERREELREVNNGLVCDGTVVNGVTVEDVEDLLDALDEMERERDEAREIAQAHAVRLTTHRHALDEMEAERDAWRQRYYEDHFAPREVPDKLAARIALPDHAAELAAAKTLLVEMMRERDEARAEMERECEALSMAATTDPRCHVCGALITAELAEESETPPRARVQRQTYCPKRQRHIGPREGGKPAGTIAWAEHLEAYEAYAALHGRRQTAERLEERGGFEWTELVELLGHEPDTWEPKE